MLATIKCYELLTIAVKFCQKRCKISSQSFLGSRGIHEEAFEKSYRPAIRPPKGVA